MGNIEIDENAENIRQSLSHLHEAVRLLFLSLEPTESDVTIASHLEAAERIRIKINTETRFDTTPRND